MTRRAIQMLTATFVAAMGWILPFRSGFAVHAAGFQQKDTSGTTADTLRYPLRDRRTDPYTQKNRNTFDLRDPSNIERKIEYDPKTRQYYIVEKIGTQYFRNPVALSFDEYLRLRGQLDEEKYFRERAATLSNLNKKLLKPELKLRESYFNRLFGNGKIDIRPQGYVDIMAGYQGQNIKNPTLPEQARKNGGFDFDLNANLNVMGNIGDKLKLPISYNTQSTFDFENQLKLDYVGLDDEIVKRFEAGNVSFSPKGTLIPGAQSLFGIKTSLQFGKLFVTGVMANQRSQISNQNLQGGAATQSFEIKANDYEENRHFLVGQYFRNNYNNAMRNLPVVNSQVQILRMEVWVTNRNGSTTDTRDIVGLMDLGETKPYNPNVIPLTSNELADNNANDLYGRLANDPSSRNPALVQSRLTAFGLRPVEDFEKTYARKLGPDEYYFNPQIGFLSITQQLREDEVLAVAYQYRYNGRIITVGEFSQDVPPDTASALPGTQKMLFLKLLKATSQRTYLPIWDLMMKNVYSVGTYNLQREDFKLNILYQQPSLGEKRFLPEGDQAGVPLLTLLNLDRLNNQNDPQPDGVFDYIEGFTVLTQYSRIVFPLLEPFGRDLDSAAFRNSPQDLKDKYVYYPLYDTIKSIAETYANLNRYVMRGTAKSSGSGSSDISLNAYNVPRGSVTVTAGGQLLKEDVDYTIDYMQGTVKILNQSILNANIPVNVQYENNAGFGLQQRNYMGLRLDYLVNEKLSIGATTVRLGERPFFTKTLYNEDPIKNSMYGLDFNYRSEVPRLTRWLDKLPFYSATAPSSINAYGEVAVLKPGHPKQIGKGSAGLSYIDDFEGTRNSIDLRFPLIGWALASTPQGNGLFPEADLVNDLRSGQNRARLSWYNIEPTLQDRRAPNNPLKDDLNELSRPETRSVNNQEIFPQRTPDLGQNQLVTFDMAYYPRERGPYNFDARPGSLGGDGKFVNPKDRWGGIMRSIDQIDFETGNVEFIEMWVQDPFINKPASTGGKLYFNLGSVSEDILRDSRRQFENGLNTPKIPSPSDTTTRWGKVPANPIQVTNAFSNDPADREFQDVGLDGLRDVEESEKFKEYLNELLTNYGPNSAAYQNALNDPANDNFRNYRDAEYDKLRTGILGRYSRINMPQGNSPIATANDQQTTAFTLYPDQEDLNKDNTLNELEEYFEYEVDMRPNMAVGANFITDRRQVDVRLQNGTTRTETWYQFRIPISAYSQKVGNIPDFKSIRFVRMFLTGFEDTVVMRFAKLDLVRNQWRKFAYQLDTAGRYIDIDPNSSTSLNTLAVNIEENDRRTPVPYRIPPGIERMQQLSNNNANILQNEQALSLQICNLQEGQARGVFKTMNMDLRQYGRLSMFTHAESVIGQFPIQDNKIYAVVRLGTDFISNYYEIKIPLKITRPGESVDTLVWPTQNNLDFDLNLLTKLKVERNNNGNSLVYYDRVIDGKTYAIYGNPNLGEIRGFFVGIENPDDDGSPICTEAWFNELRLSAIDEKGGWAGLGRVDIALSDLGSISVAGNYKSRGFGTLEQRVNERSREDYSQFDVAVNIDAGKMLPKNAGISLPVYASITKTVSTPEFDPYDLDIKLKDKLNAANGSQKDSIRNDAIDVTTTKTINFTNVKKMNTSGKQLKIWSIENLDLTYSYTKTERHNPLIESDALERHRGGVGYNFTAQPKYWEPFKKLIHSNSPWLALFKEMSLNPSPSLIGLRADVNRQFGAIRPRNVGGGTYKIPETYDKYFTFDRLYNLRWDLSRSLNLDFSATNNARVDEPFGRIDNSLKKDTVRRNFLKGGRNTLYRQNAKLTYTLPTAKLPLTNWTTVTVSYGTGYNWIGASRLAVALGNTIENSQQRNATAELDFATLYRKWKFLQGLDDPLPVRVKKSDKDSSKANQAKPDENAPKQMNGFVRAIAKLITSVKRVGITYDENYNTRLPGYTDSTEFLGQNWATMSPGFDFIFGRQPDTAFINRFAAKGLLTRDPGFNMMIQQSYNQQLTVNAMLQPVRDLTIDLNVSKTFTKSYSELYKDTTGTSGFARLSPYSAGGFSISYISFQTMFSKFEPNAITETFKKFEDYRLTLSERLGKNNPYSSGPGTDGYYEGYGKYAQDVLIPAFLAAYTGKDPNSVALIQQSNPNLKSNPFRKILPKPNWSVTYNGLSRIKALESTFTNVTLRHAYNSTLSMNSYTSALLYTDPFSIGYPGFIDTISGNFVPYFLVPNITISERFEPFIDVDLQFTNQLSTRFEYKKSRTLSLSLIDFQLSENRSTEYTIGLGWRKRGFPLPFKVKLPGQKEASNKLDNDISFRLDFSWRDDATANSRLDLNSALPTSGQKVITISPSIDYVLNNRVNIKLFFDQRRSEPKVSTSAPITTTRAGLQIRVSLAQ